MVNLKHQPVYMRVKPTITEQTESRMGPTVGPECCGSENDTDTVSIPSVTPTARTINLTKKMQTEQNNFRPLCNTAILWFTTP
jgi:hypothetical protein